MRLPRGAFRFRRCSGLGHCQPTEHRGAACERRLHPPCRTDVMPRHGVECDQNKRRARVGDKS